MDERTGMTENDMMEVQTKSEFLTTDVGHTPNTTSVPCTVHPIFVESFACCCSSKWPGMATSGGAGIVCLHLQ